MINKEKKIVNDLKCIINSVFYFNVIWTKNENTIKNTFMLWIWQ